MTEYAFKRWSDGPADNPRAIILSSDVSLTAEYEKLGTVTFTGAVSKQAQEGEAVTITVTKPDSSQEQVTANTAADGSFSATYSAPAGAGYKAVASIAEDALYQAATSPVVSFDIGKDPRTITLNVA